MITILFAVASNAQDLIIKRNGDEIKSKVMEVNLNVIKYKKFDNINGPTFEILKSDVFIIKYENGTKDVFNTVEQTKNENENSTISNNKETKQDLASLAYTENNRSFTIAYGLSALFGGITSLGGNSNSTVIGPLIFSFDKAISNKISLAIRPAAMLWNYKYNSYWGEYSSSVFFAGLQARLDYHFATTKTLDPYFGISAGVGKYVGAGDLKGMKGAYPLYGGGFGVKMYGKHKNAFLIELGYDSYSFLKVGYVFGRHK